MLSGSCTSHTENMWKRGNIRVNILTADGCVVCIKAVAKLKRGKRAEVCDKTTADKYAV